MATQQGMEFYAARLASFDAIQPTTKKKRASGTKVAKSSKWPHRSPTPAQLASAGFYYAPTATCPDSATCFMCEKGLDGWEEEDDPIREHLNYSPDCSWAINMAIEQEIEEGVRTDEDPMSAKMLEARRSTFGDRWPHEGKRAWFCKVQKMVEAGWYYCPTAESEDFVKCAYCSLSLDGWEPKDKPMEEHQRRSPECSFFILTESYYSKHIRGKKGRPSKTFRLSTQSDITANAEGQSIIEAAAEEGDSIATAATHMTSASTVSKAGKKSAKGKKGKGKAQTRAVKAVVEETLHNSSFVEPEDDDFEVKVAPIASNEPRGKKRSSSDINVDVQSEEVTDNPPKRRATRARSSTVKPESAMNQITTARTEENTHMIDTENLPPPKLPEPRQGQKLGEKRAASKTRKTSKISTATKASLRDVPADDEIDATLEADLERPLTDDEHENTADLEQKSRRLTRSRPGPRNTPASMAPVRQSSRASTKLVEDVHLEVRIDIVKPYKSDASQHDSTEAPRTAPISITQENIVKTKVGKGKKSTKVPDRSEAFKPQDIVMINRDSMTLDQGSSDTLSMSQDEGQGTDSIIHPRIEHGNLSVKKPLTAQKKSKQLKQRQTSRQLLGRERAPPVLSKSQPAIGFRDDLENSVLIAKTFRAESGHESDASTASRTTANQRGNEVGAIKRGKKPNKRDAHTRGINGIVQASVPGVEEEHNARTFVDTNIEEAHATRYTASMPEETLVDIPPAETKVTPLAKPKTGRGRPKGKAATSDSQVIEIPIERTPASCKASSKKQATTDAIGVGISTASPKFQSTYIPTVQPPTLKANVPSPTPSPQSSDAENQPPSSRPSKHRPPLFEASPPRPQTNRVPLAASTPNTSPSRHNIASRVQTTFPWNGVDLEYMFAASPDAAKVHAQISIDGKKNSLSSPEKRMTVEEWIKYNAERGEENLRIECERLVGRFESEGNRALRSLEGIVCEK
ncbi:hypothetical protein MMC13_002295 [Lambiella insularis]|nr:hypothetical protein [Lambiella insularis]